MANNTTKKAGSNIQIGKELGFETFQPKNGEDWREEMTAILEK